jgi:ABC-2 type transport system permease protein
MRNVLIICRKEWIEIRQQSILLFSVILPPLLLTVLPLVLLSQIGNNTSGLRGMDTLPVNYPSMADMSPRELAQTFTVMQISVLYLLLPGIVTSVVSSYSIVGEKTSRTLEPLLATPIRTWELLVGKCLVSLLLGVGSTWLCGGLFVLGTAFLAVSPRVFAAIISPGWLILVFLWAPLLSVIAIAVMLAISSRVNDARSAQQASAWLIIPFFAVFFGQLAGIQVLGVGFTLAVVPVLALLALVTLWIATRIFQREVILTRWK